MWEAGSEEIRSVKPLDLSKKEAKKPQLRLSLIESETHQQSERQTPVEKMAEQEALVAS